MLYARKHNLFGLFCGLRCAIDTAINMNHFVITNFVSDVAVAAYVVAADVVVSAAAMVFAIIMSIIVSNLARCVYGGGKQMHGVTICLEKGMSVYLVSSLSLVASVSLPLNSNTKSNPRLTYLDLQPAQIGYIH